MAHDHEDPIDNAFFKLIGMSSKIYDSILIPKYIGMDLYKEWSEYFGDGRNFEGEDRLERWKQNVSKNYLIGFSVWNIFTLFLIISLKLGWIQISLERTLSSILPVSLHLTFIVIAGCIAVSFYIGYRQMKEDIERLKRDGAPSIDYDYAYLRKIKFW